MNERWAETSALRASGWPHVSTKFENLLSLASEVGVRLFLPEPAEVELEELWLRELGEEQDRLGSVVSQLDKRLKSIRGGDVKLDAPTRREALGRYRRQVSELKEKWYVRSDKVYEHPNTAALWRKEGVRLMVVSTVEDAANLLMGRLALTLQEQWERDCEAAAALNEMSPQISDFVAQDLTMWEWELGLDQTLVRVERVDVEGIHQVRTPFPPERTENEDVTLSFDVRLGIQVVVRQLFFGLPPRRVRVGDDQPSLNLTDLRAVAEPLEETRSVERLAEVEARATYAGGQYRNTQLQSVRLKSAATAGGLLGALANPFMRAPVWPS